VVLPLLLLAVLAVVLAHRSPPPRALAETGRWTARIALVVVFGVGLGGLVRDVQLLV
jgi:hypothetical protein